MILVHKHDLDPKLNLEGLKRGDKVEIEIADVSPMGLVLDAKTLKLHSIRDLHEHREPLVKPSKEKTAASMPLPDLKTAIQKPMPAPVMPPMAPPMMPPAK